MGKREENLRNKLKDHEEIDAICTAGHRRQREMTAKFRRAVEKALQQLDMAEKKHRELWEAAWEARDASHRARSTDDGGE